MLWGRGAAYTELPFPWERPCGVEACCSHTLPWAEFMLQRNKKGDCNQRARKQKVCGKVLARSPRWSCQKEMFSGHVSTRKNTLNIWDILTLPLDGFGRAGIETEPHHKVSVLHRTNQGSSQHPTSLPACTAWAQREAPPWQLLKETLLALHCIKMLWRRWEVLSDGKVRQSIHGCKKISKSSSERIFTSENHCVRFLQLLARRDSPVCFRWLQPLPELVCHEDDAALQQQGGEDADDLPHAQALEEALKVHVLQAGVHGPPQLNDLHTPKKLQSAALARLASSASTAPACLLRAHRMKWTPAPRANWGCRHSAPEKRCIAQFLSCHSSQNTAVCTVCYHLQGKHNSPFQTFCKRCKAWLSGEYEASNNQTLELEAFRAETAIKSR